MSRNKTLVLPDLDDARYRKTSELFLPLRQNKDWWLRSVPMLFKPDNFLYQPWNPPPPKVVRIVKWVDGRGLRCRQRKSGELFYFQAVTFAPDLELNQSSSKVAFLALTNKADVDHKQNWWSNQNFTEVQRRSRRAKIRLWLLRDRTQYSSRFSLAVCWQT